MKLPRLQVLPDLSCCAACWKIASNVADSILMPESSMSSLHASIGLRQFACKDFGTAPTIKCM